MCNLVHIKHTTLRSWCSVDATEGCWLLGKWSSILYVCFGAVSTGSSIVCVCVDGAGYNNACTVGAVVNGVHLLVQGHQ